MVVRRCHTGAELDVATQVELVGYKVEIAQRLRLGGEMLGPIPLLEKLFREGVAIGIAFGIEACARITVPIPGTADTGAGLQDSHPHPQSAQPVELVETRNACADASRALVQSNAASVSG